MTPHSRYPRMRNATATVRAHLESHGLQKSTPSANHWQCDVRVGMWNDCKCAFVACMLWMQSAVSSPGGQFVFEKNEQINILVTNQLTCW